MTIDRLPPAISIVARGTENLHIGQATSGDAFVITHYEKSACEFSPSGVRPDRRTGKILKSLLHALAENPRDFRNIFATDV
jgi:hypothetical protein